ncbi:sensor histidine kinase [Microlunatus soli]|uniref:histidine kinase n=1 Tax=Microlunatus soli TaxID=630515 RepID=A0A1H1SZM4_9ACTN|nr:histidine kinase [Microlunatus soli]SDS53497.1 Signal transduction histidine kinase [Microlunatus soli]
MEDYRSDLDVPIVTIMNAIDEADPPPPRLTPNALLGRICISAAISAAAWIYTVVSVIGAGTQPTWSIILTIGFGAAGWVLVFFRRRRPAITPLLIFCCAAVSPPAFGPFLWASCSLATRRRWRQYGWVGAGVLIIYAAQMLVPIDLSTGLPSDHVPQAGVKGIAFFVFGVTAATAVTMVACGICGGAIGAQRSLLWKLQDRTRRAEAERDLRIAQARSMERQRIAREMHDGLAHRISQISVHAGALAFRPDLDSAQVGAAATTIQRSSHLALTELRDILGVLRDTDDTDGSRPIASAAHLGELLDSHSSTGTDLRVRIDQDVLDDLAPPIGRAVYRIVQEALTNAGRHAFGQPVSLTIDRTDGSLEITVRNPIAAQTPSARPGAPLPESGYGIVGLTERVALLGGSLDIDRSPNDFTLHARLPLGADLPRAAASPLTGTQSSETAPA